MHKLHSALHECETLVPFFAGNISGNILLWILLLQTRQCYGALLWCVSYLTCLHDFMSSQSHEQRWYPGRSWSGYVLEIIHYRKRFQKARAYSSRQCRISIAQAIRKKRPCLIFLFLCGITIYGV